jgi:hypothetical protein
MRGPHAGRVSGPGLGQVQPTIDEGVALIRDVGRKHPDLAVGDLARRARVLPAHTARGFALLQEARLVDHQHGLGRAQRLDRVVAHHVPQRLRIPVRAAEDGLLTPGTRVTGSLGPHPAGLAPLTPEQAVQEGVGGGGDTPGGKQRADALLGLPQRRRPELQRRFERG